MKSGMINLIKPPQMTSHDVVGWLRRQLGVRRIGHTGTLDPMASGVMNLLVGNATRLIPYLDSDRKTYRAVMELGKTSDTLDRWGQVQETGRVPELDFTKVEQVFSEFVGTISQVPPMFSAVKVDGMKLYQHARMGEEVEREPRSVEIHSLRLLEIVEHSIRFEVVCSRGTYVRTLIDDLGIALGTRAVMTELVRMENEGVAIHDAYTLEEAARLLHNGDEGIWIGIGEVLKHPARKILLNNERFQHFRNGVPLRLRANGLQEDDVVLLYHQDRMVGLAVCSGGRIDIRLRFFNEVK